MAFYRQTLGTAPKFGADASADGTVASSSQGANYGSNNYPRSRAVYGPAALEPNMETPTQWSPYGGYVPTPYVGGWDGLRGRLMHVSQADTYDVSPNPFPANGVNDQPNAMVIPFDAGHESSIHPGLANPTGPGPSMRFVAPPIFGLQTIPIQAVGL